MALTNEPTCGLALPAFATGTTDFAWARQSDPQRAATMDMFCQTPCGQTYTGTLLARRRGCNTPTPRGRTSVVPGGPQTFPPYFPGLMLGCIVDPEDGQYCAVKLASPTDGDCEFYKSCCCKWVREGSLGGRVGGGRTAACFFLLMIRSRFTPTLHSSPMPLL